MIPASWSWCAHHCVWHTVSLQPGALLTQTLAVFLLDSEFLQDRHCFFPFILSQVPSTLPKHLMNKWALQSRITMWLILWHMCHSYLTGIRGRPPCNIIFFLTTPLPLENSSTSMYCFINCLPWMVYYNLFYFFVLKKFSHPQDQ